jgi:hypothetical protein
MPPYGQREPGGSCHRMKSWRPVVTGKYLSRFWSNSAHSRPSHQQHPWSLFRNVCHKALYVSTCGRFLFLTSVWKFCFLCRRPNPKGAVMQLWGSQEMLTNWKTGTKQWGSVSFKNVFICSLKVVSSPYIPSAKSIVKYFSCMKKNSVITVTTHT